MTRWSLFIQDLLLHHFLGLYLTNQGIALSEGPQGSWDEVFWGSISPSTIVKKNGTYFLYYVGADGKRSTDGGPRNRVLGVATSTDGINFTKYSGNPIITHVPHNNQEEGVFSAAATLDENGDIVLYYGAVWAANSTATSVDVYTALAVSQDGLNFTDKGYVRVLQGQEEEPVGVFRANGNWHVYLLNNSGWDLYHMSGIGKDTFSSSTKVLDSGRIMGGGDPARLSNDRVAVFLVRDVNANGTVEVRTASVNTPEQLSAVARRWRRTTSVTLISASTVGRVRTRFVKEGLDSALNERPRPGQKRKLDGRQEAHLIAIACSDAPEGHADWFMYYLPMGPVSEMNKILVRTAPAIGGDDTPPTEPTGLVSTPISESQIDLSWSSASDPDSGINHYVVYRNGLKVGEPTSISFSDTGLNEATSYTYEVSAVNGAGLEGAKGIPVTESSLPDTVPPTIVSVASTNANQVEVHLQRTSGADKRRNDFKL